jgi:hypothetical protein
MSIIVGGQRFELTRRIFLFLSTGLVRLMGGTIALESPWQAGQSGSRFSFVATFGRCDRAHPVARAPLPPFRRARLPPKLRALLADDQEFNRVVLRHMLKNIREVAWTIEEVDTAEACVRFCMWPGSHSRTNKVASPFSHCSTRFPRNRPRSSAPGTR